MYWHGLKIRAIGGNTVVNNASVYNYVFNYQDHLGNNRVSYTWNAQTSSLTILEENHYYPFGLKHNNYNLDQEYFVATGGGAGIRTQVSPYKYRFNGQEYQDELGLNIYMMDLRQYDPALARWTIIDPVDHLSLSPYNAFDNNPVFWADPSGGDSESSSFGQYDDLGRPRYDEWGALVPWHFRGKEDIGFANFYNDVQRGRVGAGNTEYGNVKAYRMYIGNQKSHTYDDDSNDNLLGEVSIKPLYRYFYKYEGNFGDGRALDRLQNSLDVIGVFDPFGIADFINTTIHLARGNYKEALYSGMSILPLGDLIKLRKGGKIASEAVEGGRHLVYEGLDAAGNVRYVGITGRDPAVRFGEHLNSGTAKSLLDFRVIDGATGLSKTQARVWEQTLINQYGLEKNGGQLINKINSIAPSKWSQFGIN